jgi:hypothetical protein
VTSAAGSRVQCTNREGALRCRRIQKIDCFHSHIHIHRIGCPPVQRRPLQHRRVHSRALVLRGAHCLQQLACAAAWQRSPPRTASPPARLEVVVRQHTDRPVLLRVAHGGEKPPRWDVPQSGRGLLAVGAAAARCFEPRLFGEAGEGLPRSGRQVYVQDRASSSEGALRQLKVRFATYAAWD